MEFHRNSTLPVDGRTTIVSGPSLGEAYKRVREQFGPEAAISGSRSRLVPSAEGIGTEKVVEVLVATADVAKPQARSPRTQVTDPEREFRAEVERLERLVDQICRPDPAQAGDEVPLAEIPLAEHLIQNGASTVAVQRLLTRFAAATGCSRNDRPAALSWLKEFLKTASETENLFHGHHVFLSENDGDSLGFILNLARRQTETGRSVLLVAVFPEHDRDESRIKKLAAAAEFDAAVVRTADQLPDIQNHLQEYELVLLSLPGLFDPRLAEEGPVYRWLAGQTTFHRHLMMSMDRDFQDIQATGHQARAWNCDWLTLTRTDRTSRPAKILDLMDRIPLPVSFSATDAGATKDLAWATADQLLDRILTSENSGHSDPATSCEGR